MKTLGDLAADVSFRLGDAQRTVWTYDEIVLHLKNAYQQVAVSQRVFWDWWYLENLPSLFSYTATWEKSYGYVTFDVGVANYTLDDERLVLNDEQNRIGPAWYTVPCEATDLWLATVGANTSISATDTVPSTVTGAARAVWDRRGIDWLTSRDMARSDARYELTPGEVYGLLWQKDGVRTIRKVRVPAAQADTWQVNGSWGACRSVSDLTTDGISGTSAIVQRFTFTQLWESPYATVLKNNGGIANYTLSDESSWLTGRIGPSWFTVQAEYTDGWLTALGHATPVITTFGYGVPRLIPGEHPIGTEQFGAPRRFYRDGKNVRLEHWRHGRTLRTANDVCELPDRYALYLRDYAMARCLHRAGAGQDEQLAAHFEQRWQRHLRRLARRTQTIATRRSGVLGAQADRLIERVARPQLPWPYGTVVR